MLERTFSGFTALQPPWITGASKIQSTHVSGRIFLGSRPDKHKR